jgi:NAD(P)-dependent dehydrogenase (short-subunit alcohol dehydrogenase family)
MQPTILITGSSRGLGRVIAETAFKHGYKVIIHGRTDSEQLNQTYTMLPGSIKTFFDLGSKKEITEALENLVKLVGPICVLVNHAGTTACPKEAVPAIDRKKVLSEYKINVLGAMQCTQELIPGMLTLGFGSVINIALKRDFSGISQAALIAVTRNHSLMYQANRIRINSISLQQPPTETTSLEEIAALVLFLADAKSAYISGTDFSVGPRA